MPKLSVIVHRDEDLKPLQLEIQIGRKKLFVDYRYSPAGDIHSLEFEGRPEVLPSLAEIVMLADHKRIDRIATIELIKLINTIDEITLLKTLQTIQTIQTIQNVEHATVDVISGIRDLSVAAKEIFSNSGFEQDFLNWKPSVDYSPVIEEDILHVYQGSKSCRFDTMGGSVKQQLFIPMKTDWFSAMYIRAHAQYAGLKLWLRSRYVDGTQNETSYTFAAADTWYLVPIPQTANKYLYELLLGHYEGIGKIWVDCLQMVF